MYLSVCVKNNNHYKRGEIFNTFNRNYNYFIRPHLDPVGAFDEISTLEYTNHFIEINDEFNFPKPHIKLGKFRFLNNKNKFHIYYIDKFYKFDTDLETLAKLHVEVFFELRRIKTKAYTEEQAEEISELLELLSYNTNNSFTKVDKEVISLIKNRLCQLTKNV